MKGYVSALLGMAAEDIEASACAEISAGNALDMALCADPPSLLAAVDLALSFEQSRQGALDGKEGRGIDAA